MDAAWQCSEMEKLIIARTQNTPKILLDPEAGLIELTGKSYPENTSEQFGPVFDWLEEYFDGSPCNQTIVNIDIDYFNSSTSRALYEFFTLLNAAVKRGYGLEVNWIYDEEDFSTEEDGEEFNEEFSELGIKLVKK